jgi:hypothetical protein
MTHSIYPKPSKELAERRQALAPEIDAAFHRLSDVVFRDAALSRKTKQLTAVAVAHAGAAFAHSLLALETLNAIATTGKDAA